MGNNLTGQLIKDTYEQLVQISGSILTDGTGSNINNLTVTSSFATTASYALTSSQVPDALYTASISDATVTFTKGDASTFDITVNNVVNADSASLAATSSFTPNAIVTASLFGTNNNISFEKGDGSTFDLFIDDVPNASFAVNATNAATASLANTASFAITASYAVSSSADNLTLQDVLNNGDTATGDIILTGGLSATSITGSTVYASSGSFVNLNAVSASFGYVQTVTGSAVIIGDEFIILNADTPAARYAGLIVYDSGSGTPATASFEWDGLTDNWVVVEESGNSAVVLTGATGSKGVETLPTLNTLVKGGGHHQLIDSNISDSGTLVSINSNTQVTGSLIVSAGITGSLFGTASFADNALSSSYALTASFAENVPTVDTGSLLVTASISDATITFTKGDASTFDITVNNVVNADSASVATTASFATNALSSSYALTASYAENAGSGGFPYTGSAEISGSLRVLVDGVADGYTITSGSLTGSLIDNLGTPTSSEAIKHLVYLSQTEYDAITPDSNTMYVISGSGDVVENLIVSGSLEVSGSTILTGSLTVTGTSTLPSIVGPTAITGSLVVSGSTIFTGSVVGNVSALSISSNTASMDLDTANFFTLQLVSGSNTFINPSNIKAGQTINLLVNTTGSATVSFPSSVKQVSGSSYVPTTTTSQDIVTFISFDNTSLYLSNVKNLV
jgi:hypothetical protein